MHTNKVEQSVACGVHKGINQGRWFNFFKCAIYKWWKPVQQNIPKYFFLVTRCPCRISHLPNSPIMDWTALVCSTPEMKFSLELSLLLKYTLKIPNTLRMFSVLFLTLDGALCYKNMTSMSKRRAANANTSGSFTG